VPDAPEPAPEQVGAGDRLPEVGETPDAFEARRVSDDGAVQGPDRGAKDQIGRDAGLGQRAEHADLDGAPAAATAEDKRRLQPSSSIHHSVKSRQRPVPSNLITKRLR